MKVPHAKMCLVKRERWVFDIYISVVSLIGALTLGSVVFFIVLLISGILPGEESVSLNGTLFSIVIVAAFFKGMSFLIDHRFRIGKVCESCNGSTWLIHTAPEPGKKQKDDTG